MMSFILSPLGRLLLGLVFVAGLLAAAWFDGYASGLTGFSAPTHSTVTEAVGLGSTSARGMATTTSAPMTATVKATIMTWIAVFMLLCSHEDVPRKP